MKATPLSYRSIVFHALRFSYVMTLLCLAQPFAIADAPISLKLTTPGGGINDCVISHLQQLRNRKSISVALLSGLTDTPQYRLSADYKKYFQDFSKDIDSKETLNIPEPFFNRSSKRLLISSSIAALIRAAKLNIVSQRCAPSPQYDLIIVINVFPYFNAKELMLAATNITAMMKDGVYPVHNDRKTPLWDSVAIHHRFYATGN